MQYPVKKIRMGSEFYLKNGIKFTIRIIKVPKSEFRDKESVKYGNSVTQEEISRNDDSSQLDEFKMHDKIYTLNSFQNAQSPNIKNTQTTQNTPRGQIYDIGRVQSCEREKQGFEKKYLYIKNSRKGQKSHENYEQSDALNQNSLANKQIHTSTKSKYRNVIRGNPQSADKIGQYSKHSSDIQLPATKQFRNYKMVTPFRQSLNMSFNSSNPDRSYMSNDHSLNKIVESQKQLNGDKSIQKREGQFYSEEEYGYGEENIDQGFVKQSSSKQNTQNSVIAGRENNSDQRTLSQNSQEKLAKIVSLTKNKSRIQSANNQNNIHNPRNGTPNKNNLYKQQFKSIDTNTIDSQKKVDNSTKSLTNSKEREHKIQQNIQQKKSSNKNQNKISITSQKENLNYKTQYQQRNQQNNKSGSQLRVQSQNKLNKIKGENKTLNSQNSQEKSEFQEVYEQDDDDFEQSENVQIDEETHNKFQNNCKDFYKDKKKEKFQIAELDEYEEDFESQVIFPQNKQNNKNKINENTNSSHYNQLNVSSDLLDPQFNKSKEQHNKKEDLTISNQYQLTSSHDQSEMNVSKINNSSKFNIQNENKQAKKIQNNSKLITDKQLKIKNQDIDEYDYEADNFEPEI